jgi:hypothetical protein
VPTTLYLRADLGVVTTVGGGRDLDIEAAATLRGWLDR